MPTRLSLRIGCIALGLLAGAGAIRLGLMPLQGGPGPQAVAAGPAVAPVPVETLAPVFRPCAHCHEIGTGAQHRTGPHLDRLFGRRAGQVAGYPFSAALRASGIVWDETTLARFLRDPQAVVPGTRMPISGIEADTDLSALLAFLREPSPDQPTSR